jgi:hypothetical protein
MKEANTINYKIDWHSGSEKVIGENGTSVLDDRKHYFDMLRRFLIDIKNLGRDEIDELFERYNVYLVNIDDIPRVNIDEPK